MAGVLEEVIEHMIAEGDVSEAGKWRAIEYLAADYLSGVSLGEADGPDR